MGYKQKPHSSYRSPRQVQAARTRHARRIDEALKAPRAKTSEQWLNQPNRFDLPNIDTPKGNRRSQEPKHEDEPTAMAPEPSTSQHRQFTKYLRRQSMRKVYGTRY